MNGDRRFGFPAPPIPPAKPWTQRYRHGRDEMEGLTAEALEAYKTAFHAYEQAVLQWRSDCEEVAAAACRLLVAHGFPGERKTLVKGRTRTENLNQALRAFGPQHEKQGCWTSNEEQWLRTDCLREIDREQKAHRTAVRDRAIQWLLQKGKQYGADFTAETAAAVALGCAADEKITGLKGGGYLSFNGKNCDGPCRGWDGESPRCECGNRRVSWVTTGSFEEPIVYGEAY